MKGSYHIVLAPIPDILQLRNILLKKKWRTVPGGGLQGTIVSFVWYQLWDQCQTTQCTACMTVFVSLDFKMWIALQRTWLKIGTVWRSSLPSFSFSAFSLPTLLLPISPCYWMIHLPPWHVFCFYALTAFLFSLLFQAMCSSQGTILGAI